jgi:GntR family transcriptional regulator/MocR family aminotransferase
MRLLYGERRKVLIDCLHKELGFGIDITGGHAGMHLSVTLKGIRDQEVVERARRQSLWLAPLSSSYIGQPSRQGLILGFGSAAAADIPRAVNKLRILLATK